MGLSTDTSPVYLHSYSSRPLRLNLYDRASLLRLCGNVYYYALSLSYLQRLGCKVKLYTDPFGERFLSLLPYDEIITDAFDSLSDIHPRFWASAKMAALAAEKSERVIHIDGDVFIKTPRVLSEIETREADIIVQHYESAEWYRKENRVFCKDFMKIKSEGIDPHSYGAYNTGVFGFNSTEAKEEFLRRYFLLARHFTGIARKTLDEGTNLTPDVVLEQTNIYQLAKEKGYLVKKLLPSVDVSRHAKEIGYQHVLTSIKFDNLDKCRATLCKINPSLSKKIDTVCQTVLTK